MKMNTENLEPFKCRIMNKESNLTVIDTEEMYFITAFKENKHRKTKANNT